MQQDLSLSLHIDNTADESLELATPLYQKITERLIRQIGPKGHPTGELSLIIYLIYPVETEVQGFARNGMERARWYECPSRGAVDIPITLPLQFLQPGRCRVLVVLNDRTGRVAQSQSLPIVITRHLPATMSANK